MSEDKTGAPAAPVRSAEELRMMLLEQQLAASEKLLAAKAAEEKKHSELAERFLKEDLTEDERQMITRLVMNAVKDGKFEAMVYSFPSLLCTDQGRAINNADPSWPDTLQGKAKSLYERFVSVAKPQGYKLKAMIINFPGGVPGDVGFFLNWEPEAL